jgi:hypothetical protein
MTDREFWLMFRSALLMIVSAIEKRYKLGRWSDGEPVVYSGDNITMT